MVDRTRAIIAQADRARAGPAAGALSGFQPLQHPLPRGS